MKIYCSRSDGLIDKFMGKDIWVKVYSFPELDDSESCDYVRILGTEPGNHFADNRDRYIVNYIPATLVEGVARYSKYIDEAAIKCDLIHKYTCPILKLVEPIETITTDELLDILLYNRENKIGVNEIDDDSDDEDL